MDVVVTTLAGQEIAILERTGPLRVSPALNGYVEVTVPLAKTDPGTVEIAVARRALQVWDGDQLRFFGKVWEPLQKTHEVVSVSGRSPLAELAWRRVQALKDYTATNNAGGPWDAGAIVVDRVAIQNARRNTYLRATLANVQASANRLRTYNPGKREDEILQELAAAAEGFFYRESFVAGVAGVMADLHVLYPDAGTERPDVRFEYGDGTLDNLDGYEHVEMLPLNSVTAAGAQDGGGRITRTRDDAASIADHGLFEDELAFTEQADVALLEQAAQAAVRPAPIATIAVTPGATSPMLYDDFDVGDFVRVKILDEQVQLEGWARVASAALEEDTNGVKTLAELTVELQAGGLDRHPSIAFRLFLDDTRARLEQLERRVETISASTPDPGANAGSSGGGSGGDLPEDPGGGGGDPPPPPDPPAVENLTAGGFGTTKIIARADVDLRGLAGETYFVASIAGVVKAVTGPFHGSGHHIAELGPLARHQLYDIVATATTSSGSTSAATTAMTDDVDFE